MFALIYFIEFYALSDIDSKVKNSFGKSYDPFISLGKLILIKVLLVFKLFYNLKTIQILFLLNYCLD